jgi:FkbM family methyltransferase
MAFEPNGSARAILTANLALNHVEDRVQVWPFALADFSGPARFTTDLESSNHLETDSKASGALVEVREFDALVKPSSQVTVMKVDAEGFDEAVLRGARESLKRERPVVIVETWAGAHSLRQFLGTLGYEFFLYEGGLRSLPPDFMDDANLVAIHAGRLEWVRDRLGAVHTGPRPRPRAKWIFREDWPGAA